MKNAVPALGGKSEELGVNRYASQESEVKRAVRSYE